MVQKLSTAGPLLLLLLFLLLLLNPRKPFWRLATQVLGPDNRVPCPTLDITGGFQAFFDNALKKTSNPPFDPYKNDVNFLLATFSLEEIGATGDKVGGLLRQLQPDWDTSSSNLGVPWAARVLWALHIIDCCVCALYPAASPACIQLDSHPLHCPAAYKAS
jgi:hypothetical protein